MSSTRTITVTVPADWEDHEIADHLTEVGELIEFGKAEGKHSDFTWSIQADLENA